MTEKSIEQRRAEVLLDTIQFYSVDPEGRRSVGRDGVCQYLTSDGRRCAVGRYLMRYDPRWEFGGHAPGLGAGSLAELNHLPTLGLAFWRDLQALHDTEAYWMHRGLSPHGVARVTHMDVKHCDGLLLKRARA